MQPLLTQLDASLNAANVYPTVPVEPGAAPQLGLDEARLGITSSLFAALRHKHAPAAEHSLRVAWGCAAWASALNLPQQERDCLETAALLHDIGKIGVPDSLLLKPGKLATEEATWMDQYRLAGLELLDVWCLPKEISLVVRNSSGWYDGSRPNYPLAGDQLPRAARMLAIVDAFDSMTTDQVYRRALSRERALHELFSHAGTQFDPQLVESFAALQLNSQQSRQLSDHWLRRLSPQGSARRWQRPLHAVAASAMSSELLFQQKLLDNMCDAVVFVDRELHILQWNRGAERLTGIAATAVLKHVWSPSLIGMQDDNSESTGSFDCPIKYCVSTSVQSLRRLRVLNRHDRVTTVDVHTLPVVGPDGQMYGAAMILHDASSETTLEERCQSLHERATKDPLTQVANRAEFDRTHQLFVQEHLDQQLPYSLIICDIDHFKSINDTYGHPAGDDVLRFFGQLLKSECRQGDLVARYGGEEFVVLCADCNSAAATRRAEQLCEAVRGQPQSALNGNVMTVSFGVTEIQLGDTPESMLRRADRALLEAKRQGRDRVIELGGGLGDLPEDKSPVKPSQVSADSETVAEQVLITAVPLQIALEKIRGYVLDHHAEVLSIKADRIQLLIDTNRKWFSRRRNDRHTPFVLELALYEQRLPALSADGRSVGQVVHTHVRVTVRPKHARDRRKADVVEQACVVLQALKSYLMAHEATEAEAASGARPSNPRGAVRQMGHEGAGR